MQKTAVRMRIRPPRRRNPADRLRSRIYYRKHRAKIRLQRRRYLRQHKTQLKRRKLFQRFKPTWYKKRKPPVSHPHKFKPHKFHISVPKKHK